MLFNNANAEWQINASGIVEGGAMGIDWFSKSCYRPSN